MDCSQLYNKHSALSHGTLANDKSERLDHVKVSKEAPAQSRDTLYHHHGQVRQLLMRSDSKSRRALPLIPFTEATRRLRGIVYPTSYELRNNYS